jgi:hypothetical protein
MENKDQQILEIAKSVNKRIGLLTNIVAKNAARVKSLQKEAEEAKSSEKEEDVKQEEKAQLALSSSIRIIAMSLQRINATLAKITGEKVAQLGQVPAAPGQTPAAVPEKEKDEEGPFSIIKSLFSNPAVVAALAGLVYFILPKQLQDELKGFVRGFSNGLSDAMGENEKEGLTGLNTSIKIAGGVIATVFGAKFLAGIAGAVTDTIRLVRILRAGKLGKVKGGKMKAVGAATVIGGAAAGAAVMTYGGDEKKLEAGAVPIPTEKPETPPPPVSEPTTKSTPAATAKSELPRASDTSPPVSKEPPSTTGKKAPELSSVIKNGSSVDFSGLNGAVKTRLALMAEEYEARTGQKIQVNSAYRDPKKQAELYAKFGSPKAAPPGRSWHEKGLAFDINSADANRAVQLGLFDKYGFKRPVASEPWHVEASETRGGPAYADNPVRPGAPVAVVDKSGKPEIPSTGKSIPEPAAATTSADSTTPTAVPESASTASSGQAISQASQEVKANQSPKPAAPNIMTASTNNTSQVSSGKSKANLPIPSPIADRGSLSTSIRHYAAYI